MQDKGLVGLLSDRIQSPLFNAGANIFAASSRGDPGMGLGKAAHAAGSAHQRQLREKVIKARMGQQRAAAARAARAEQAEQERRKAWGKIAGGDPVLSVLGPDKGAAHLAKQRLPTAFQRNYDFARSQGFQGTPADFKRSGATQVNVGAGEKKFDQELGKGMAELFMSAQKAGTTAQRDLADLQTMETYASDPSLYTGTGGALVHDFKKTAGTLFGVNVDGVASGEGLQRLSNKIALSFKDQLPGPMSNADREFLQALPANLNTSPEGNRQVIQIGIAKKRWEIERALAVRQFQQQNGRLTPEVYAHIADVDRKWGAQMSGLVQQMRGQTQAPNRSPVVGFPEAIKRGGRIKMNADGTFSQ